MSTAAIDAVMVPPHPFFDFNDAPDRIERRHDLLLSTLRDYLTRAAYSLVNAME